MHLVRVFEKARPKLSLKSPPFFHNFYRSSFVARIGNWLWFLDAKKTCEQDVEESIRIGLVQVKLFVVDWHSGAFFFIFKHLCNGLTIVIIWSLLWYMSWQRNWWGVCVPSPKTNNLVQHSMTYEKCLSAIGLSASRSWTTIGSSVYPQQHTWSLMSLCCKLTPSKMTHWPIIVSCSRRW